MKLNVGSGTVPLPGYVNIDLPQELLKYERPNVWADAQHMPFGDETFEYILSDSCLITCGPSIAEAERVLKKGGILVVMVYDYEMNILEEQLEVHRLKIKEKRIYNQNEEVTEWRYEVIKEG